MKIVAIGLVLLFIMGALYVVDRTNGQRKTLHLADSLDSVNSSALYYFVDSSSRWHDQNYNQRIIQLKRHIDFQDRQLLKISKQLDSIIHAQHGRESN